MHRHPSVRHVRCLGGPGRYGSRRGAGRRAHDRLRGLSRLPGDTPHIDTNLAPAEIITAIELPPQGFATNYSYLKIRDRLSYAFALVSVAAAVEIEGDVIKEARLALGGVAHKPWRKPDAEAALRGERAERATFAKSSGSGWARRATELSRRSRMRRSR